MNIFSRIQELAEIKGISLYLLSQVTGISQSIFSRLKTESTGKLNRKNLGIVAEYFCVNPEWLLTGKGEMLKGNTSNVSGSGNLTNTGDGNSINVGGSVVNVSLPPDGQYKIIKPDGTVELHSMASINTDQRKIEELERTLALKDEIIKAKDETISVLRSR